MSPRGNIGGGNSGGGNRPLITFNSPAKGGGSPDSVSVGQPALTNTSNNAALQAFKPSSRCTFSSAMLGAITNGGDASSVPSKEHADTVPGTQANHGAETDAATETRAAAETGAAVAKDTFHDPLAMLRLEMAQARKADMALNLEKVSLVELKQHSKQHDWYSKCEL